MSALYYYFKEIQEMLQEGHSIRTVSYTLEVPIDWVYNVLDVMESNNIEYDPA